jgi:hypothetical protein
LKGNRPATTRRRINTGGIHNSEGFTDGGHNHTVRDATKVAATATVSI